MTRPVDGSMPFEGVVTAQPGGSRRPKSAGFQSANRKLVAAPSDNSYQRCSRPRPPSASAGSPRPRPCSAAMQLWRQPGAAVATRHKAVVQQVVREEIDEQRHVTLEAQRQLHELQATIARRQEEIFLAQRHLQAFGAPQTVNEGATQTSKLKPAPSTDIVTSLKDEIAHQDAYKKRLRFMHERLMRQVQYLEATADLLADRRRAAHRERALCRSRVKTESDKHRQIKQQLRELHAKRTAFKRNALPVLESYRDELASRLVINQRRHDADRRREELLRFIGTRTTAFSKASSTRTLTNATAAITRERAPPARVQRRDSYNILVADADESKRETLFAVYEGQYARVLRETGEVDLTVVLERFHSYRESTARLREIEAELKTEGARLASEQQTHSAMASRLRVSGPTDVAERRQRLRDRLEGALLAQQLEKTQARERASSQLKAFVYVQQGVLHIVELLQCLEDRPGMALSPPPPLVATSRMVMGGSHPAEVALKSVAPALQTLVQLARDVGRRGLQREWFKLRALGYSVPQVARLEQFAPEGQSQRGPFAMDDAYDVRLETKASGLSKRGSGRQEDEVDEERRDATVMRRAIKKQEKEALRQAEAILRQAAEAKKPQGRPSSPKQLQQHSDAELVAAHFREQRRSEKQEHRYLNGNVSPVGHRRSTVGNVNPMTSPRRRQPN